MNPLALARAGLDSGELVELMPSRRLAVALYWQLPRAATPLLQQLTSAVLAAAARQLEPAT
jgi:LysR family transcriptional regulator (chromosome initiation inhibitor)